MIRLRLFDFFPHCPLLSPSTSVCPFYLCPYLSLSLLLPLFPLKKCLELGKIERSILADLVTSSRACVYFGHSSDQVTDFFLSLTNMNLYKNHKHVSTKVGRTPSFNNCSKEKRFAPVTYKYHKLREFSTQLIMWNFLRIFKVCLPSFTN